MRRTYLALPALLVVALATLRERQPAPRPASPDPGPSVSGGLDLPAGATQDWWASVQEYIRADQLRIQPIRRAQGGDDPAGLRAWSSVKAIFDEEGVSVQRPTDAATTVRLRLEEINGRPASPSRPRAEENRVIYERGTCREVYINRPEGLEQTFEFDAPVERIEIVLGLETSLSARREAGRGLIFGDEALQYGEATAVDAAGRRRAVEMRLEEERVRLSVPADFLEGAAFPVVVDPLFSTPSWTAESDQADANFGYSVSTAGDVNGDGYNDVIVGAYAFDNGETDEGRAFVYHGSATGLPATPS